MLQVFLISPTPDTCLSHCIFSIFTSQQYSKFILSLFTAKMSLKKCLKSYNRRLVYGAYPIRKSAGSFLQFPPKVTGTVPQINSDNSVLILSYALFADYINVGSYRICVTGGNIYKSHTHICTTNAVQELIISL
jgi:hypothetical protein